MRETNISGETNISKNNSISESAVNEILKVLLLIDSLIDFLVTFVSKNKTKQEKTDFLSKMYLLSAFAL